MVAHEALVTLPIEAVARLDRMATASLLATGLAHEIANPLSCLIAALDAIEVRVGWLREREESSRKELEELAADVELASVSGNEIFAQVRDFQQFLRPRELETSAAIDLKPPILRAVRMARARLGAKSPVSVVLGGRTAGARSREAGSPRLSSTCCSTRPTRSPIGPGTRTRSRFGCRRSSTGRSSR